MVSVSTSAVFLPFQSWISMCYHDSTSIHTSSVNFIHPIYYNDVSAIINLLRTFLYSGLFGDTGLNTLLWNSLVSCLHSHLRYFTRFFQVLWTDNLSLYVFPYLSNPLWISWSVSSIDWRRVFIICKHILMVTMDVYYQLHIHTDIYIYTYIYTYTYTQMYIYIYISY